LQWTRGQNQYYATAPAHIQRASYGFHSSRSCSGRTSSFSRSGYTRARNRNLLFPLPNFHTEVFTFLCVHSAPPRLFSAGQCGYQVGTKFWEVACDEHDIGGDGEYCFTTRPQAASTHHKRRSSTLAPS
jgi:hypothetical protein